MKRYRAPLLFLALTAAAWPALSQQAKPSQASQASQASQPAPGLFGEEIDVRVVNVEVVVTDRDGNRVTGLKPADLRLRVDGKEVPIDYFTEVRGGDAVAPEAGAGDSAPVQGLPSLAPGTPVGTSYLVFIDDFFSVASRRDEVLKSLKDDLARLGPEDRMAVVAFDGKDLDMLSSWSSSANSLSRTFDQALGRKAHGLERLGELRSFDSSRRTFQGTSFDRIPSRGTTFENRLDLDELGFAQRLSYQVEKTITAAVSTLRGFAAPPGRKVLILLSGGWPYAIGDYVVNNPNRPILERDLPQGEELFRPLADTANRLGYTIYSVDVPGLEFEGNDASDQSPRTVGLPVREQEIHSSLQFVANQTGGKALFNAQRGQSLTAAAADTRSYYWLGFTPPFKGDDVRHKVTVEAQRPGLTVRSRGNYLDLSRRGEVSLRVESAMLFGSPPGAEKLPVQLGEPVRAGRREVELPVTITIPTTAITTVPLNGKFAAELELRVAALDERGDRSDIPVIPIKLSFDQKPDPGKFITYEIRLRLRRAKHHLVFAVFDPLDGRILTTEADIAPK
jgi:VWFA-related protein